VKLSVMQENLARGLSVVSRAVSSRSTLPVLANVLLRTEDAGLKLTATNLEIGITYWVPGKVETDGATTVPARLLSDLVASLPGSEKVDLELQGTDTLHLRCGRFATHVKGIDADEFPTIQTAGERPTTRIAQKVLKKALEETIFAAASDEARPILTGVLARFEGSRLTLAAADNYRIAVRTIDILDPVESVSVVIPARALQELERTSSLQIDGVAIASSDANGKITLGQVTDHSTKTGLKWGVVGGALLGIVFPPSIIGSAVALGGTGAILGKVRNAIHRKGLADELAGVMKPNTAGIIALVQDTAVVAVREAMAKADAIVEKAIDQQVAAEIQREAKMETAAPATA